MGLINEKLQQAITKADLAFKAVKVPCAYNDYNGNYRVFGNRFVTTRKDNGHPFEVVSSAYKIRQHVESFNFLEDLGVVDITKCDSVNYGARMIIQAKLPNNLLLENGDEIGRYITCVNSHDRSSSSVITISPIRFKCMNQFNMFTRSKGKDGWISIRHNDQSDIKFSDIKKILGLIDNSFDKVVEQQNKLLEININRRNVSGYVRTLFCTKEELIAFEQKGANAFSNTKLTRLKNIVKCFNTGTGQSELEDNAYRFFNGITYYLNHEVNNSPTALIEGTKTEIINNCYKLFI